MSRGCAVRYAILMHLCDCVYLCCQDTYSYNFIGFLKRKKKIKKKKKKSSLQRLQLMQNAAARILTHMRQMQIQSVTPGLTELHWAPLLKKKIRLILKLQQLCAMWDCVCWSSVLWQAQKLAWQLFQIHLQLIYRRGTVGNGASHRQNSVLISTKQS